MKIKRVTRYDPTQRKFRLFRLLWVRGTVGDGSGGYSAKLAIALRPVLFRWQTDVAGEWRLVLLGLDIHHRRSYGGVWA